MTETPRPGHWRPPWAPRSHDRPSRWGGPATPVDFAALYRDTFPTVWRVLGRLGVPRAELDDAAQNVYLVAHRRLGDFRGQSSARTWLAGIAVRVAADLRRTRQRKPEHPLDEELPDAGRTPLEAASQAQSLALVGRLLDALPEERREVFVLAELEELTAPEISQSLGVNLNTVYSRLRLARRDFEAALEAHQAGRGAP